jgi:hypothetical protein
MNFWQYNKGKMGDKRDVLAEFPNILSFKIILPFGHNHTPGHVT